MSSFSKAAIDWEDDDLRLQMISHALRLGHVGLLLGAGVSVGVGFPSWEELVRRVAVKTGTTLPTSSLTNDQLLKYAETIQSSFPDDEKAWAQEVRSALYHKASPLPMDLLKCSSLRAVTAVTSFLASHPGGTDVVTLNFDDCLERSVELFGYGVRSMAEGSEIHQPADVRIWHPHGLLANDGRTKGRPILSRCDFNRPQSDVDGIGSQVAKLLRDRFWILVGVSGDDNHMDQLLLGAKAGHVTGGKAIWAVTFARIQKDSDCSAIAASWKKRGVWCEFVKEFDEIERILLAALESARVGSR